MSGRREGADWCLTLQDYSLTLIITIYIYNLSGRGWRWVGGRRESERERERERENSKTLFFKNCSLGSVKNLTTNP